MDIVGNYRTTGSINNCSVMQNTKLDHGPSKRPKLAPDLPATAAVAGTAMQAHPLNSDAASSFPKAELTEGLKGPCDQCGSADPESDQFARDQVLVVVWCHCS